MEFFSEFTIQKQVVERFTKSIANGKMAHAYLFYGSEGCGKEAFAIELAKALNCSNDQMHPCNTCSSCVKISRLNHPDIRFIFPAAKNWKDEEISKRLLLKSHNPYSRIDLSGHTVIQIERIRELKNESKYKPYEANRRVYIITEAEKMTRESANAFLKLLEEPPESILIILITSSLNALLSTIRSRCQLVYFSPLSGQEALSVISKFSSVDYKVKQTIQIAQGNLKAAFDMLEQDNEEKRQLFYSYLRAIASGSALNLMEAVDKLTRTRDKNLLKEVLNLLILWFQDVLHLVTMDGDAEISNIDFETEIKNFAGSYRNSDFEKIVHEIDSAITNINRNVYNPLILTLLGIRIKRQLIRQDHK